MGLNEKYTDVCNKNSDGRYCYIGETNATPISCSGFTKQNLYESGVITKAEKDDYYSFWAGDGIVGILADTKRFKRHEPTEKPKNGWIQWYHGYHVSTYYNNGCFEACPRGSHYLATNGKTAVGFFTNNHNCSGGSLTCYYEILEGDNMTTIDKIISRAEEIANDDSHGYNNTVGKNLGADFGQTDYDCGGFVSDCLRHASLIGSSVVFEPNSPTGTWGYDVILTSAGFEKLPYNASTVKRGDILIKDGRHTEICYEDGKRQVGSHNDYDGKPGDSSGREISIVNLYSNYWDYMYRLKNTTSERSTLKLGSTGSEVKELQTILNTKINAGLTVDGSFGQLTLSSVKAYQTSVGIYADGVVGVKTWAKLLEETVKSIDALGRVEEARNIINGKYGSNPERKTTLTSMYGATEAQKIQDIVTLAYK